MWLPDRHTHRETDAGQSDPYVPLCFAGDTIIAVKEIASRHGYDMIMKQIWTRDVCNTLKAPFPNILEYAWHLTWLSIGIIYSSRTICLPSLKLLARLFVQSNMPLNCIIAGQVSGSIRQKKIIFFFKFPDTTIQNLDFTRLRDDRLQTIQKSIGKLLNCHLIST